MCVCVFTHAEACVCRCVGMCMRIFLLACLSICLPLFLCYFVNIYVYVYIFPSLTCILCYCLSQVNGINVETCTHDEVVTLLKQAEGSVVTLAVRHFRPASHFLNKSRYSAGYCLGATRGVTLSTSAFLACHQC